MAERPMADKPTAGRPTAEKIAPWWQRVLRRAVDGLRSGFGLFRRSQADRSGTEEELSNSGVEADPSGAPSIAAEPQNQNEAEPQIAEKYEAEEESQLNKTSSNPGSDINVTEEQVVEAAAAENVDVQQAGANPSAAHEPTVISASEIAQNPEPEPLEAQLPALEIAESAANPHHEEAVVAQPEEEGYAEGKESA